ncbi:multidrug ABC transporter permease [Saccharomonospora piscinae]|uniref:Transport permease protein n=1 Tax=Saccharomonospora piscinae TaxID=687388 RepID=A0A1V9AAB3_SACPI|nr:ABC transporter permease [Saccharomonospora piscinae]OQO94062.1 multidrug ABC transporter permease [Saccharomonospora piscinae]TLW95236.1 ABC transporter permease [Saccharomonospora piscinae]
MTTPTTASTAPATDTGSLRAGISDGLTIFQRNLLKLKHQPSQIVMTFTFPLVSVILFGYVFGSAIPIPGGGDYREYLMPGLFVMSSVFGVMGSLTVIAKDNGLGVMDRYRSMPMARSAVPFGQTAADLVIALGGLVIMALVGLLFGWRTHNGLGATLAGFGIVLLLQYAVSWVGVYLGALAKNEETAARIGPLIMPITMISNIFVPTNGMPTVLQVIADWNPISAATAACRQLFGNPGPPVGPDAAWPLQHPVVAVVGWCVLLLVVFVPLSIRRFRDAGL